MRTTITIDDQLFLEAKQLAAESHKTFANVVDDALRQSFVINSMKKMKMRSIQFFRDATANPELLRHLSLN